MGRYGAFTVAHDDLPTVDRYIRDQRIHHRHAHLLAHLEE